MTETLRVRDVSKSFARQREGATSLKYKAIQLFSGKSRQSSTERVQVLRNVSFSVSQGEALGIIGANGSGKSTLLKIISGVLSPDTGQVTSVGTVAALLELGAGFHPELTGRKNVFLYGSVLGFSTAYIRDRFDEIVAYAELEGWMDVPVKHYSSGMYVRLAFAVAVILDPEILILDEVLAVGDVSFQRKCLDTVYGYKEREKTIVLVTHSLEEVERFCDRAILLDHGDVVEEGPPEQVIATYQQIMWSRGQHTAVKTVAASTAASEQPQETPCNDLVGLVSLTVHVLNSRGVPSDMLTQGESLSIIYEFESKVALESPDFGLQIFLEDHLHSQALGVNTRMDQVDFGRVAAGSHRVTVAFEKPSLAPGTYVIEAAIWTHDFGAPYAYSRREVAFQVVGEHRWEGTIAARHDWIADATTAVTDA